MVWSSTQFAYSNADLEFDFSPNHPNGGAYEDTDLCAYVSELNHLLSAKAQGGELPLELRESTWSSPWLESTPSLLQEYVRFLDWRRWRVEPKGGYDVVGIALPPALDFRTRRFMYRP